MADIPYIQQAQEVKITGQDNIGNTVNYVGADANGNLLTKDSADGPVIPGTVASNSQLIGGQFNTVLPTLTSAQQAAIQVDSNSRAIISPLTNSSIVKAQLQDNLGQGLTSSSQIGSLDTKQALDTFNIAVANLYYSAPVNIRQTTITSAGATVWTMLNPTSSTKTIFIERIFLIMSCDTDASINPTLNRYELVRFSGATPTGGTVISVIAMNSTDPVTQVSDVRYQQTGLTTTGITFENAFSIIGCPSVGGIISQYERENIAIRLAAGQGLAIRLNIVSTRGQGLTGEVIWSER